jgi:uncharacterized membrane protein
MVPPVTDRPASLLRQRFDRLDLWRGLAMVWMACFHFSFDLNQVHAIAPQNFYDDPFWTLQRQCIVSLFLLGAGAGQAVAIAAGQTWARFWRRWGQIVLCALLVSVGSYVMFPRGWISFGVLHGMAVMLILLRVLGTRLPPARLARAPLALAGVALLAVLAWRLPHSLQSPLFDTRLTNWVGLITRLPPTEDYVPVLPWFGMMLAGYLAASLLLVHARPAFTGPVPFFLRPLSVLGGWSLTFYMLHQPILIGSLELYRMVFP